MHFNGRKLVIATMHQKQQVIAPIVESKLGVKCILDKTLNTDLFGTFSGDIERIDSVIEVLRAKCTQAMKATKTDLAIASEGSFGCHPYSFFSPANEEWLMFLDSKNQLEIVEKVITFETNLNGAFVKSEKELLAFANKSNFPSHALIIKDQEKNFSFLQKGISSKKELIKQFNKCLLTFGFVFVETDMRALFNPTRMKVIERTTQKLIDKIMNRCPVCETPGFGIVNVIDGLPCESCNSATKSILYYLYHCSKCEHTIKKIYPSGKFFEDPMFCDVCNP
ncbi:MAG: hypothetical protein KA521_06365 [Crocinitomicaceae bacterium]|nr:hypothetical protein [Crocinitomicaceae bacterium]